jgi:3-deoxy-D-manno-octulosonate 8-phosphate phosphatase (KDO 8-P phosphatase)
LIDTVFLDIDGVLTDGAIYVDSSGNETKRIIFEDIDAIFELKSKGKKIGFITGEDNSFCQYVRDRFKPDFFLLGCKDKLEAFKELENKLGLDILKVCYAGDSKKDIPLLEYIPFSLVPADVDQSVKDSAKIVLKCIRGQGVIKEVAQHVIEYDGKPSPSA